LFDIKSFLCTSESQSKHVCGSCMAFWAWKRITCVRCYTLWVQISNQKELNFQQDFSKCWIQSNEKILNKLSRATNFDSLSHFSMSLCKSQTEMAFLEEYHNNRHQSAWFRLFGLWMESIFCIMDLNAFHKILCFSLITLHLIWFRVYAQRVWERLSKLSKPNWIMHIFTVQRSLVNVLIDFVALKLRI
jgi:hypothetical protein